MSQCNWKKESEDMATKNRFEATVQYARLTQANDGTYRLAVRLTDEQGDIIDPRRGTLDELEAYLTHTYKWTGYRDNEARCIRFPCRVQGTFRLVPQGRVVTIVEPINGEDISEEELVDILSRPEATDHETEESLFQALNDSYDKNDVLRNPDRYHSWSDMMDAMDSITA